MICAITHCFFKVNNKILDHDTLFCAVYFPPEGSYYENKNAYCEVEEALINFGICNDYICLMGDFNARTGNLLDIYSDSDEIRPFIVDSSKSYQQERSTIMPERKSQDTAANNNGYKLIDFCRTAGLAIVNGRTGKDADCGRFTCRDKSVVDYSIMSYNMFSIVHDFEVLDFCEFYSDVHCPIVLNLKKNILLKQSDCKYVTDYNCQHTNDKLKPI